MLNASSERTMSAQEKALMKLTLDQNSLKHPCYIKGKVYSTVHTAANTMRVGEGTISDLILSASNPDCFSITEDVLTVRRTTSGIAIHGKHYLLAMIKKDKLGIYRGRIVTRRDSIPFPDAETAIKYYFEKWAGE